MANRTNQANKKDSVAAENARLRAENQELKKELSAATKPANSRLHHRWKGIVIFLCAALAAALLIVGNIFFWAGNTLVDTNKFVSTTGPVISQPSVQSAVAEYTTNQLFMNYDVQGLVQQVLPPKADFLAPQITSQLKTHTQGVVQKVVASPKFQQAWLSTLRKAHDRLINFAKTYQGSGDINLGDIFTQITNNLQGTKLSFLVGKQLPSKYSSIHIATVAWLPALHKLSVHIGLYQSLTTGLFIVLSAVTVWLSKNRRRMVLSLAIGFGLAMIVTLISIRVAKAITVSRVNPDYQQAVRDTMNIIFKPLVIQTYSVLLAAGLTALVAWVSGPYRSAKAMRNRTEALFAGKLHQTLFASENRLTKFFGNHKRVIQWTIVALTALVLLAIQLTPLAILLSAIVMLILVLITEVLAAS